jgi:hypothetical protein
MKIFTAWSAVILVWMCLPVLLQAEEPASTNASADRLKFQWAFLMVDDSGNTRVVDFSQTNKVKKGDALRVYLQPLTDVYLYLFLFDAQKQLRCLFPKDLAQYDKGASPRDAHILPGDEKWFVMDENKGPERFFLLASTQRLTALEQWTRKMIASPADKEIKARVLDEIQTVRRAKGELIVPVEKGVPIAGTVVAITRGGSIEATLSEATGFYSRTLRIEHE